ncbi:TetR/AcrR family transcriptional regulator [Paenibacillus sp. BR2-3]|uniref:TetR/AcrR family transcriptional regulator n=1 Tax=Paenibacillus sp. BR2-3 TaxID=3048494 RepID=UPI003977AF25
MDNNFTLRERKKIQTMVSILDAFLISLELRPFHEIGVEDVCEQASISKMTFFRYFSSKEEVLDYFVLRWCCQRSIEVQAGTYQGEEGIRHVFQSASEIPSASKILVALLQYYSKLKEPPVKKDLMAYERYLISGNNVNSLEVQILPLRDILFHYANETDVTDVLRPDFVDHLLTLFYGIPFQVYTGMIGTASLSDAYQTHLDLMFALTRPTGVN